MSRFEEWPRYRSIFQTDLYNRHLGRSITNEITPERETSDILSRIAREAKYEKRTLTIRFDSALRYTAGYDPLNNEILVGISTVSLTEESLQAVVSHEQTHEIFSRLSETEQQQIVKAVMEHPDEFAAFFEATQRFSTYEQAEYYSVERANIRKREVLKAGKESYIQIHEVAYNGQTKTVDVTRIVDELLAFSNQHTQAQDELGQNAAFQLICQSARIVVGLLNEDTRRLLESKGFFNVDPTGLVDELLQDKVYARARKLSHKSFTDVIGELIAEIRRSSARTNNDTNEGIELPKTYAITHEFSEDN